MKPLIVFSREDMAGSGMGKRLIREFGFEKKGEKLWQSGEITLAELGELHIYSEMKFDFAFDYIIVASRHRSESGAASLTAHIPGNWGDADFGGKPRTLNIAYASKLKVLLREMKKAADKAALGWNVCLEVDHHGPTIGKPIIYAEIGSNEKEWRDERAIAVVSDAIMKAIESNEIFPAFFGVGGNHYAPRFTAVALDSETKAIGHILPKYKIDDVDFDVFAQGLSKSVELVEGVLFDWKGMSAPQREKIISFCEKVGAKWEKI